MSERTTQSPTRCSFAQSKGCIVATPSYNNTHKRSSFTIPAGASPAGVVFLFLVVITLLSSCSNKQYEENRETLLHNCKDFSDSINSLPTIPFDRIPSVFTRWKNLETRLLEVIERDTLEEEQNMIALSIMSRYGDQTLNKIFESIDYRLHDFTDLLTLERDIACRLVKIDRKYFSDAEHFYDSLGNIGPLPDNDMKYTEQEYLSFLESSLSSEFKGWNDVEEFLSTEDRCYTGYLQNPKNHSQKMTATIIEMTERLASRLMESAQEGKFSSERLVAYMTVRTSRRQILCARQELTYMGNGKADRIDNASMSISGIIAPFLHFNPLLIASRNQRQMDELRKIGSRIPDAFYKLESRGFILISHPDCLPNRIAKDYISFMMNY